MSAPVNKRRNSANISLPRLLAPIDRPFSFHGLILRSRKSTQALPYEEAIDNPECAIADDEHDDEPSEINESKMFARKPPITPSLISLLTVLIREKGGEIGKPPSESKHSSRRTPKALTMDDEPVFGNLSESPPNFNKNGW